MAANDPRTFGGAPITGNVYEAPPSPDHHQGCIMSNQPQAHVADERAAFDEAYRSYSSSEAWRSMDADCHWQWNHLPGYIWRTARAAIPAGADVTLNEFQQCTNKDCGRYEFGGKWSCRAMSDNACDRPRIAVGAPAETPKPVGENLPAEAWVTPLRYGSRVTFYKPPKPDGWDDDEDKWYCYPLVRAAQPAPAPATDARELPTLPEMQAIIRKGSLVSNSDAWTIAENVLSMLSANSQREAG